MKIYKKTVENIHHHLESSLAASPLLLQKHALNERRFEEVKNGHRLQNWTPI
jgi:hypothetical protein